MPDVAPTEVARAGGGKDSDTVRAGKAANNKAAQSAGESERTIPWQLRHRPTTWSEFYGIRWWRWCGATARICRHASLGVFLTCYLHDGAHTVRGLAADLNVSKPAITRALDRLGELDLARRKVDPMDRRSVLVQRTLKGTAFLRDLRGIMSEAANAAKKSGTGETGTASRKIANG